jgi:hypothetical protein
MSFLKDVKANAFIVKHDVKTFPVNNSRYLIMDED